MDILRRSFRILPVLLLILCLCACSASKAGTPGVLVTDSSAGSTPGALEDTQPEEEPGSEWSPDIRFSTVDSEGKAWTDEIFSKNTLTLINYWAYWCGPCVRELPALETLSEAYAGQGVMVLGISDEEYEADNRTIMKQTGVKYPCLRYTEDFDAYLNTGYIPTTIRVDSQGKVLGEALVGSRSYDDWASIVEEYLQ